MSPSPDTIRFGVPALPEVLHPLFATDAMSARVSRLLYLSLVDFGEDQRPEPRLALGEPRVRLQPSPARRLRAEGAAPHAVAGEPSGKPVSTP